MIKVFALVGIDGEVHVVHQNREELEAYLEKEPMVAEEIAEIDYNDDPVTERGEELREKIMPLLKNVRELHINKQVGFYGMHIDDRYQLIYDILTREGEPFEFGDSHKKAPESEQPQVDLEERFET